MKLPFYIGLWILILSHFPTAKEADIYLMQKGSIDFRSEAPLELIQATSEQLQGALDVNKNTFAFAIKMESFDGFNSLLQREHFCEKFMECDRYPKSSFQGKIIESIDYSKVGSHDVRAKGKLTIHGLEKERIIRGKLELGPGGIVIDATISVPLEDHNIDIPKVVAQNISEIITVKIHAELFPK